MTSSSAPAIQLSRSRDPQGRPGSDGPPVTTYVSRSSPGSNAPTTAVDANPPSEDWPPSTSRPSWSPPTRWP